jgi:hypothetical protein
MSKRVRRKPPRISFRRTEHDVFRRPTDYGASYDILLRSAQHVEVIGETREYKKGLWDARGSVECINECRLVRVSNYKRRGDAAIALLAVLEAIRCNFS